MLRQRWFLLSAVVAAMLTPSACTGNDGLGAGSEEPTTATSSTATSSTAAPTAASSTAPSATSTGSVSTAGPVQLSRADAKLEVSIEQLRGGVDRAQRPQLRRALSRPIASWIDGAFPNGGYPTNDFAAAFPAWTPVAAALAREHRDVTTNAALGGDLTGVTLDKRRVRLFIFATDGVVGGATARVILGIAGVRPDGSETRFSVAGELYLTREASQWLIFGYDLQRRREFP